MTRRPASRSSGALIKLQRRGDVIKESIGAFPRVILAEGRAIARNEDKTYKREFKVITGVDGEVEILEAPLHVPVANVAAFCAEGR